MPPSFVNESHFRLGFYFNMEPFKSQLDFQTVEIQQRFFGEARSRFRV